MSYSFAAEMKDGQMVILSSSGDIPEGKFHVSGHEDDTERTISVTRQDKDTLHVLLSASGHARKN
jgi:hypothetical protein